MSVWLLLVVSILVVGIFHYYLHSRSSNFNFIISSIIESYKCALGQSVEQFSRVCCLKHIILIGICLLSFNILINYFKTLILSNLVDNPLIKIDSIGDLVNFMKSTKLNISLVSNKIFLTWQLLENSQDENFHYIFLQLVDKSCTLDDIYKVKCIVISYTNLLENIAINNKHLGFHLSRDQYFGSTLNILYSKLIQNSIKLKIDTVISILFENGLEKFVSSMLNKNRLNINQTHDSQKIRIEDMRGILMLMAIVYFILIIIFIIEYFSFKTKERNRNIRI